MISYIKMPHTSAVSSPYVQTNHLQLSTKKAFASCARSHYLAHFECKAVNNLGGSLRHLSAYKCLRHLARTSCQVACIVSIVTFITITITLMGWSGWPAGVDPDKHLDLQTLGWDKCTAAMEEAISSEKAEPIFKAAADKFQEVAATGQALPWLELKCVCPDKRQVEGSSPAMPITLL